MFCRFFRCLSIYYFSLFSNAVHQECAIISKGTIKGGPLDLGTKNLQNTKNTSLYSQSQGMLFIHKTPVVESHPTTNEIRDLLRLTSTSMGNTVYFYMSSSLIYMLKIHRRSFKHSVLWTHYGK